MSPEPITASNETEDKRNNEALGSRVVRGSIWTMGGYGGSQLIRLGSNLVLTRLLFPEAFGLMAVVNAVLTGLAMFSDMGLNASIVQSKHGDDPTYLDTAWTLQILRGIGLFVLASAAAIPMAGFYEQPQLAQLLPAAALSVLLVGFNSTSLARMQRHLALREFVMLELAAQALGVLAMLGWAFVQPTVWVLVAGALVSSAVKMIGSHYVGEARRHRLAWDREAAGALFSFGKWIFLSTILGFLVGQADRLIFGKLVSLRELGIYSIAALLSMLPTLLINRLGNSVVFPAFSRSLDGGSNFASVYARTKRPLLAMGGALVVVLLGAGDSLVETLYDERYAEAGLFLQILAIGSWFRVLEVPPGSALLAWGKPRWLATANGCKLAGLLVLMPLGFEAAGFVGAIAGFVAAELLRYAVVAGAAIANGSRGLGSDLASSAGLALAATAGIQVSGYLGEGSPAFLRLIASAGTALAIFAPIAVILAWNELSAFLDTAMGGLKRSARGDTVD
jgi:O-antigen/teichoic acid export membrane protein